MAENEADCQSRYGSRFLSIAMQLPDLLANSAARFPARECVVGGGGELSFADVDDRAGRAAAALREAGAGLGSRVALLARNEPEYFELQVAVQRAGAILVPLNHRLAARELRAILGDCEPEVIVYGSEFADVVGELGVPISWELGAGGEYESALAGTAAGVSAGTLDSAAPCSLLYTSGTTGRAKGAVISNGALWARVNLFGLELGIRSGDSLLFPIPMFHTSSALAYAVAYLGGSVVLMRDFDAAGAIASMARHRTSHAVFVPTMLGRLVEELGAHRVALDALRLVLYGGSAIAPDLLRRAMAALGCQFVQGYGLTEAINATMLRADDHDPDRRPELLVSAGTATISYEFKVVDPLEQEVPPGELGEIVLRGPGLMDGYWRSPTETANVMRGGWLHTGDLGRRTADGYLYVTDRLKDVIVSGGENVYSREVEDALYSHPAVREVAVIGIPSPQWGESVHAEVVLRPGVTLESDELVAHCRRQLAGYKTPKSIAFVDELPKSASGKILKREVREKYWRDSARAVG
jgi:acyl-CoA synthetase (AMP-forming)/AMP-acid ligase II